MTPHDRLWFLAIPTVLIIGLLVVLLAVGKGRL